MRDSIENPACEFVPHTSSLMLVPLTWSHQLDLLRHGGAELVGHVAPVFALKRNQVLVEKHKSSIFVLATLRRHVWWLEFFSIFCPPVSNVAGKQCLSRIVFTVLGSVVSLLQVLTLVEGFPLLCTQWSHFGEKEGR